MQDAAWLQPLQVAGLLRKSFRPDAEIVPLRYLMRYLMRYRQNLIAAAARQVQAMQKVLTEPERSGYSQRSLPLYLLATEPENPTRFQRHLRGECPGHHHRHPRRGA